MRLRIAAVFAVGAVLIGVLGWPLISAPTRFDVVSVAAGNVTFGGFVSLAFLGFLAGLIAYFVAWPYGREVAVIAAPAGLAVLSLRSGSMADFIRYSPTIQQRQALFAALRWEPLLWLVVVAAGLAGALLANRIAHKTKGPQPPTEKKSKSNDLVNAAIALVASVLIAQFCISILARDVRMYDRQLGPVGGQPAGAQIAFALLVAFGLAAFLCKVFLNTSYLWPAMASAAITAFATAVYLKHDVLGHLGLYWPAAFFSNAATSILPVQMVSFGTLGSIAGYWLGVKHRYWRKNG
jgi:hypothetical protein